MPKGLTFRVSSHTVSFITGGCPPNANMANLKRLNPRFLKT